MANSNTEQNPTESLEEHLWNAVKESDEAKTKQLLAQGAKANFEKRNQGEWGESHRESIIHVALRKVPANKTIVEMLLHAGADPNAPYRDYNWKGGGSTETAFLMVLRTALSNRDTELLQIFLESKKVDVNQRCDSSASSMRYDGSSSWYPIHTAANSCYYDAINLLLEHGAKVDAISTQKGQSEYGFGEDTIQTPLHIICGLVPQQTGFQTNDEICRTAQLLLQHGANPNSFQQRLDCLDISLPKPPSKSKADYVDDPRSGSYRNPYVQVKVKETALHIAFQRNNTRLALLLLRLGADINIPWIYGSTEIPSMNLMQNDMMACFWSPETHHYFPNNNHKTVKTILLCSQRLQWKLPKDLLYEIIKYSLTNEWIMEEFIKQQKTDYQTGKKTRKDATPLQENDNAKPVPRERSKTLPEKTKSKCIIS